MNDNNWKLQKVNFINFENGITKVEFKNSYSIYSNYNFEKITLFKNFDTHVFFRFGFEL